MSGRKAAAFLFMAFAFGYFVSALLRAVTATLAPVLTVDFALSAADLGLLGGAYFAGFALMQLPLGSALDRIGARGVQLRLLAVAICGCAAFALAGGFVQLLLARALIGVGLAASLMAPLTAFRRLLSDTTQLRANSWMLMTGSMGMLASTLPVQWLLPVLGWRSLFWLALAMLAGAAALVFWLVPAQERAGPQLRADVGYANVVSHPVFIRMLPIGLVLHAGAIAMQTLWAGPWLTQVAGQSPAQAAEGLFIINSGMLLAFGTWGAVMPRLSARGWTADRLIAWVWPVAVVVLLVIVLLGPAAGAFWWALWCMAVSAAALAQPMVGQAFPKDQAGRALSAYNLVIFVGVFALQWGIGLSIDALASLGLSTLAAYRATFALLALLCLASGVWFWRQTPAGPQAQAGRPAQG